MKKFLLYIFGALLITSLWAPLSYGAQQKAATLYIAPATGSMTVGSTFTVSFYVDTGSQFINVVDAQILFPPDKLQVVSPSTGSSFINVWAIQPSYSNTEGTMSFRGAVPSPGVSTNAGLISTVSLRVKSVGTAAISFGNNSKVLLNDGLGTNVLQQTQSAVYNLELPPPSGPIVTSATHPDQRNWYSSQLVSLSWAGDEGATGYSYMISDEPVDTPDNIADGTRTTLAYSNLANGRHYFHIKSLRSGVWGGTTHFAINVDAQPPADFPIDISPAARTAQRQPVIKFFTTDADSGLDHYEIKVIPLGKSVADEAKNGSRQVPLYTEVQSPYIPAVLDFGRYDVYVRAYDSAGNYQEKSQRLDIVQSLFEFVQGQGIEFRNVVFIPWSVFWGLSLLLLIILGIVARRMHWWHRNVEKMRNEKKLPDDISDKLKQLKAYQQRYGKAVSGLLVMLALAGSLYAESVRAVGILPPPVITTTSKDIFNDEIFYVGGSSVEPAVEVLLYVQGLDNGETNSYRLVSDDRGNWFYRHNGFLSPGSYLIWAQDQRGEELSPPSPQITITVAAHALQLGSSRFSYEAVYFVSMLLLGFIVIVLVFAIWFHYHHGRRKHAKFIEEKAKLEESVRRGFALLQRDIQEEIQLLSYAKQNKELNKQEKEREEQLLADLEIVKRQVGEEIWELTKLEG